jgi:hypothetical protein
MAEHNPSKDSGRKPPREVVGEGTAWLIAVAAMLVSGAGFAFYGASQVGAHVKIELSCKLIARAQKDGMLNARQRREVTQAALASSGLSWAGRAAAERVHDGCRGVRT